MASLHRNRDTPDWGDATGPGNVDDGDVTLQSPQVSLQVDCAATQGLRLHVAGQY